MSKRLTIVQNRPTQFDMPLYAQMLESDEWDLQVIYTDVSEIETTDSELGRSPVWDHVPAEDDCGIYLDAADRKDVSLIVNRITAHNPELAVLCGYYPRLHARLVRPLKRRGLKIGLRSDNTLPHGNFSGWRGLAKRVILPLWLARYDTWHPVGTLAQQYLEKMSFRKRPVFTFPYAVDVEWFENQSSLIKQQKEKHRSEYGLAGDAFVVLGIMKWHPREDPFTLLRAFAQLHEAHPQARLVLIGDGPLCEEVVSMAEQIGDAVVLPGYQPYSMLPLFYAISDVFVHPSIDEPWGVSIQEALACGLPVLLAEGVGSRFDLLEEGKNGWSFPDGDERALQNRIERLITRPESYDQISSAAVKNARKMDYGFSQAQFGAAISEVSHRH